MSRAKRAKMAPLKPPRDPRLEALAEQASRLEGWVVEWQLNGTLTSGWWMLQLRVGDVGVEVSTAEDGALICYASYTEHWTHPAWTPAEALRSAYAALGVALDQAEDAFGEPT